MRVSLGKVPKSVITQTRNKREYKLIRFCQIPFYGEQYSFLVPRLKYERVCFCTDSPTNQVPNFMFQSISQGMPSIWLGKRKMGNISMMGRVLGLK